MARFAFPKLLFAVMFVAASTNPLYAHPGHAIEVAPAESPLHYFVQPEHALAFTVFAAAIWFVSRSFVAAKQSSV